MTAHNTIFPDGMNLTEKTVLALLAQSPCGVTSRVVATRMLLDQSNVCKALTRLKREGLCESIGKSPLTIWYDKRYSERVVEVFNRGRDEAKVRKKLNATQKCRDYRQRKRTGALLPPTPQLQGAERCVHIRPAMEAPPLVCKGVRSVFELAGVDA